MYSTLFAIGVGVAIGWQITAFSSKLVWGLVFAVMASAGEILFRSYEFKYYMKTVSGNRFLSILSHFGMSIIWNGIIIAVVGAAVTYAKNIF